MARWRYQPGEKSGQGSLLSDDYAQDGTNVKGDHNAPSQGKRPDPVLAIRSPKRSCNGLVE